MEETTERMFSGIKMRASVNTQGKKCFIGYARNTDMTGKDLLLICSAEIMQEEGKYHVWCIPMKEKRGMIVTRFSPAYDSVEVKVNYAEKEINLFVNGAQGYLFRWNEAQKKLKRTELTWKLNGENFYTNNVAHFIRMVEIKLDNIYLVTNSYREILRENTLAEILRAVGMIQEQETQKHYRATQTPFDKLKDL